MSDKLKKLTGKNPKDFESVAFNLINNSDEELFCELVSQDDFLFDFVKQNVARRLEKVCNESNYLNLLNFLKYYSASYEGFIVSILARYADEDLTDKMLDIFENGTENEKIYCAKFFSLIKDPLALDLLKKYAYSDNGYLSGNCALTLFEMNDTEFYNDALNKLKSDDDFTVLEGVKFLAAYSNSDAVPFIIEAMKKSSMPENIAGEIPYLCDLFTLYKSNQQDALFVVNSLINGLGEILGLVQVIDFDLYNFFEMLIKSSKNSQIAVVLLNAADKFETLTENDEYLFDESKETKQEILDLKELLSSVNKPELEKLADEELKYDSLFVYTAIEFSGNTDKIRALLSSCNQTLVLKALEVLKSRNMISQEDKRIALDAVSNENIKNVIMAI